jgi:acetate kinase
MVRGGTSWIPGGASPVDVRVIPTDEELMIATRGIRVLA